jgi:hypothetical protein
MLRINIFGGALSTNGPTGVARFAQILPEQTDSQGDRLKAESSSFLKKRTKKRLVIRWAPAALSEGIKVFCFFFSKKKTFL